MSSRRNKETCEAPVVASANVSREEDICGICQDEYSEKTRIHECGHHFCFDCIVKWANTSNTCPLCQTRFLRLYRCSHVVEKTRKSSASERAGPDVGKASSAKKGKEHHVKHVDRREENAMRVLEELDSGEQSIHTDDDEDEMSLGSEGDYLEEDFIVPDGVIIDEDDNVIDMRASSEGGKCNNRANPFGRVKRDQPDCIFTTKDGERIIISWDEQDFLPASRPAISGSDDSGDDSDFNPSPLLLEEEDDDEEEEEEFSLSDEMSEE